ncbi:hypothetical protein ACLOJK_029198 [Asimina triloba]
MRAGMKVYIPVSVVETEISKRYDTIPSATLYPNADEIEYLQRLVIYKRLEQGANCPSRAVCTCLLYTWHKCETQGAKQAGANCSLGAPCSNLLPTFFAYSYS